MAPSTFDDSQPPFLIVRVGPEPTDAEFDAYLREMSARIERATSVLTILDLRASRGTTRAQQLRQAAWMKAHAAELREKSRGTAFVMESAVHRFALSAILLVQPVPTPYCVASTMEEAFAWGRAQLRGPSTRADQASARRT